MRWNLVLAAGLLACACGGEAAPDASTSDAAEPVTLDAGVPSDDAAAPVSDSGLWPREDAGESDAGSIPPPDPNDIFFVGNSFTFGGPIPSLVRDLAVYAGHSPPRVEYRATPGQTLEGHRNDDSPDGAPARVAEGWDVLVLQENSLRPTDALGRPERFKEDATWFHDLAVQAQPDTRVILYETWARRAGHSVYDSAFADPADMQEQLRFHYFDAAMRYIPTASSRPGGTLPHVVVAPCGDAWERQLSMGEPPRLHSSDDWHAGTAGQYLNALVIYGTIYDRRTRGLQPIGVDEVTATLLQRVADETTGASHDGPLVGSPAPFPFEDAIRIDVGPTAADGWTTLAERMTTLGPLETEGGVETSARLSSAGFDGTQTGGSAANELGWPGEVSSDSLWVGSFDGHAAALDRRGRILIRGIPAGRYAIELFASRDGDDSGRGRLTRYQIGGTYRDLEAADNTGEVARFEEISPDERGELLVEISVSPDGTARFAYLGALILTHLPD